MTEYMTAEDLAVLLLQNPKDVVCVTSDNFELSGAIVPQRKLGELVRYPGELKKQTFRDAFDGESYQKDVVRLKKDGKTNFVQL